MDWCAAVVWSKDAFAFKNISRFTCVKFELEYRNFLGPCRPFGDAKLAQACFARVMFNRNVSQNKSFQFTALQTRVDKYCVRGGSTD